MGKITGFLEATRELPDKRPVEDRLHDYREFTLPWSEEKSRTQAGRCMDCGVPFCHTGCPLGNIIPDFNDLVYRGNWKEASNRLHATNNFPEFTGRLCPAPCEQACVLGINEPPVTIEEIEKQIVERAFSENWIQPEPPEVRTGKTVAVIGSGPAGLAAAQQMNRAGHHTTLFERDDRIGGLLRYGIPDFKMEKNVIDRRLSILDAEGVKMETGVDFGVNRDIEELKAFDAVILATGSTIGRPLPVPGSDLDGVHLAMDFLKQNNKAVAGDDLAAEGIDQIRADGKNVIVIGGGDTGSDCIGTSNRHGAQSVTNFELLPKPPKGRPGYQPWPYYPMKLNTSTSHQEGVDRAWGILTKEILGENGKVTGLVTVNVRFIKGEDGRPKMEEITGTEKTWPADLIILALGFAGPEKSLPQALGLDLDAYGNIKASETEYKTSIPNIFAAGDCRRGQSLIVWAISEGREAARIADEYLMGKSDLPTKGTGQELPRIPFMVE